jgi:hypothetical protein
MYIRNISPDIVDRLADETQHSQNTIVSGPTTVTGAAARPTGMAMGMAAVGLGLGFVV